MAEQKKFIIGARSFYMVPVTLGQLEHLVAVVAGLTFPATDDPMAIVTALSERLPKALACVLVEDGKTPGDMVRKLDEPEGLAELAAFYRGEIPFETAVEAAAFFLSVNPISSVSAKLSLLANTIGATKAAIVASGLNGSTPALREENSASEPVSAKG